ncbi:CDP-glycerol glycerophosphotransferase family protein [Shewanella maritima]|nr:CDP-glycerol glycerophosphotransferase family protein [Shewanella maritima]
MMTLSKASLKCTIVTVCQALTWIIPRQHKAVCGCYKNKFADNSKYLYLHWLQQKNIKAIWISGDKQLIRELNQQGLTAYYRWSLLGVFHSVTAKYYVYNSYIGDVNQYLANGAVKINLWHGSPLKRIEHDINNGPLNHVFKPRNWQQHLIASGLYHQQHTRPDLMLAPSPLVEALFSSAFEINADNFLRCGNPRTDFFQRYSHLKNKQQMPETLKSIIDAGTAASAVKQPQLVLYAPSWRDSLLDGNGSNPYLAAIDFKQLNLALKQNNQLMLLRLHPNEQHLAADFGHHDHIIDISHWQDIYAILNDIDVLISDYSSIFIDALASDAHCCSAEVDDSQVEFVNKRKTAIALFKFDEQMFTQDCRSQYDYVASMPAVGPTLTDFAALTEYLAHVAKANSEEEQLLNKKLQAELTQMFWQHGNISSFEAIDNWLAKQQGQAPSSETPPNSRSRYRSKGKRAKWWQIYG